MMQKKKSTSVDVRHSKTLLVKLPNNESGVPIISPPAKRQKVTCDIMYVLRFRRKKTVCVEHTLEAVSPVEKALRELHFK